MLIDVINGLKHSGADLQGEGAAEVFEREARKSPEASALPDRISSRDELKRYLISLGIPEGPLFFSIWRVTNADSMRLFPGDPVPPIVQL